MPAGDVQEIEKLHQHVVALAGLVDDLSSDELAPALGALQRCVNSLAEVQRRLLAAVVRRDVWAFDGYRSAGPWIAFHTGLPVFDPGVDDVFTTVAASGDLNGFRQVVRAWQAQIDAHQGPDPAEVVPGPERESLRLGESFEGWWHGEFRLSPANGARLHELLERGTGRYLQARRDGDPSLEPLDLPAVVPDGDGRSRSAARCRTSHPQLVPRHARRHRRPRRALPLPRLHFAPRALRRPPLHPLGARRPHRRHERHPPMPLAPHVPPHPALDRSAQRPPAPHVPPTRRHAPPLPQQPTHHPVPRPTVKERRHSLSIRGQATPAAVHAALTADRPAPCRVSARDAAAVHPDEVGKLIPAARAIGRLGFHEVIDLGQDDVTIGRRATN